MKEECLSWQPSEPVAAQSHCGVTKRCGEPTRDQCRLVSRGWSWDVGRCDQGPYGVSPPASVAVENDGGETDAILMEPVGRVVQSPLEFLVLCQVLSCHHPLARFPARWLEARDDREVPSFLDRVFSVWDPHVDSGRGWHAGRVRRSLDGAGGVLLPPSAERESSMRAEARFLPCHRAVSLLSEPPARADLCVVAEAVKDLAAKWHCVSWAESGMQRRCCGAVRMRSASQPKRREAGPPTDQAPAPGALWFGRDTIPLRGLRHQGLQCVSITLVGHKTLAVELLRRRRWCAETKAGARQPPHPGWVWCCRTRSISRWLQHTHDFPRWPRGGRERIASVGVSWLYSSFAG